MKNLRSEFDMIVMDKIIAESNVKISEIEEFEKAVKKRAVNFDEILVANSDVSNNPYITKINFINPIPLGALLQCKHFPDIIQKTKSHNISLIRFDFIDVAKGKTEYGRLAASSMHFDINSSISASSFIFHVEKMMKETLQNKEAANTKFQHAAEYLNLNSDRITHCAKNKHYDKPYYKIEAGDSSLPNDIYYNINPEKLEGFAALHKEAQKINKRIEISNECDIFFFSYQPYINSNFVTKNEKPKSSLISKIINL